MIVVEQNDELAGLLMTVPIHGTVLRINDRTLSSDVSGAIEYVIEEQFSQPVSVLMMNSWGADMSPANPEVEEQVGVEQPNGFEQMERVGVTVADEVVNALSSVDWMEDPMIWSKTGRVRIDRQVIGYDEETFLYEYGGVYCGSGLEDDCETETTYYPEFDDVCIPFSEEFPAPRQTLFSVGQLGDLHYFTFPGEPGTLLIESVVEQLKEQTGVERIMVFGYSQDYIGYSLLEEDWWQGGYEASGSIWGPAQGRYLSERVVDFYLHATTSWWPFVGPEPTAPFSPTGVSVYEPTTAVEVGSISQDVDAEIGELDTVEFVVAGNDPWLGVPIAFLETEEGEIVQRLNGEALTSEGLAFYVDLEPTPGYGEAPDATERRFDWRFSMPARHKVVGVVPSLEVGKRYRLRVDLLKNGEVLNQVTSSSFVYTGVN
jgi:hypothetical protein